MPKPLDTTKLRAPLVAVDTVVFSILDEKLHAVLIQINEGVYKNKWAVPGGLVKLNESLDEAAVRVLVEKTSLENIYLEQLYTFGEIKRDTRGRSISVAYFALVNNARALNLKTKEYYNDVKWTPVSKLPTMAFDHKEIIRRAHTRLKSKLSYSNIAYSLLPKEFTLSELQKVYEIILGEKLDKRNFRKKIDSLGILEELNKKQTGVTHRPALLYKFKKRELRLFN